MSYNLNSYFQLGQDSASLEQNDLVMNTIRTPVDVQSGRGGLSKVTFKVPKVGMLTGDSMVTFQIKKGTATTSNATPNFISGAIGAVERLRITIDNKVLTDLERPSLLHIPKAYTEKTENENSEFAYKFLGNQFRTTVNPATGCGEFDMENTRYFGNTDVSVDDFNIVRNRIDTEDTSKVYGIHLKDLGAQYLEQNTLPVFLLGAREMIIEIFFYKDCREYVVATQGSISSGAYEINYPLVELVTTHIQVSDEDQLGEMNSLREVPFQYPLKDNYIVKGAFETGAAGIETSQIFRINAQNREVHRLMMVNAPIASDIDGSQRVVANQKALSLGDVSLQIKANGLNYFERPIVQSALLYQQTTYANDGMALKLPYNSFTVDKRTDEMAQSDQVLMAEYRGTQQYVAIDFTNGNQTVLGGGTVQKQAIEIEYKTTARATAKPNQVNRQIDTLFYLTVSKLLTISANKVDISF